MKLLILAQTPPPLHGQSLMVETAVQGLPGRGVAVHHVNLRLSHTARDIGRWRLGKILAVLDACFHAIAARFTARCDTLYYVPAPAKRGALYRDWVVMALCRPFFPRLVLHFHTGGLGDWLEQRAWGWERAVTRLTLGRADLALVLADPLRGDAASLQPRRIVVVPNGIPVASAPAVPTAPHAGIAALFLGQCSRDKGALDAVAAVRRANDRYGETHRLTLAGACPDPDVLAALQAAERETAGRVRYVGFADEARKAQLWAEHDCLLFPTRYAHEAQPLVVLEALAHGRPVAATRWRAIPSLLPADGGRLVDSPDPDALAAALHELAGARVDPAVLQRHVAAHFSIERHLQALADALAALDLPSDR